MSNAAYGGWEKAVVKARGTGSDAHWSAVSQAQELVAVSPFHHGSFDGERLQRFGSSPKICDLSSFLLSMLSARSLSSS